MERMEGEKPVNLEEIRQLLVDIYVPFSEIEREIPWPNNLERWENDSEHSFSTALIAGIIADKLGLDAHRAASFGLVHDIPERYAGDTGFWDTEGRLTKEIREAEAMETIREEFKSPWLVDVIDEYNRKDTPEAQLVYGLDKLLALMMMVEGGGHFWKSRGITYEDHLQKHGELKEKIAGSPPIILDLYDEVMTDLSARRYEFFAPTDHGL